jgi:uncharacterized protein (TIGR03118 family)
MAMRRPIRTPLVCLFTVLAAVLARTATAQVVEQHNLVSNGTVKADLTDDNLVNAWGLTSSSTSPWWVANNGSNTSTLYTGDGVKVPLVVSVPGAPTGAVFNATTGFELAPGKPAAFIFSTEEGTIRAWNRDVTGTNTMVMVDHSPDHAVYKGLAILTTHSGTFLYATNFHTHRVEVYDSQWKPVRAAFIDPFIPRRYAPFGIQAIGGAIFVTYALHAEDDEDDVPGPGRGFVDAFEPRGLFFKRIATRGLLNAPWGLALAPEGFGKFSGHLLVGNFGDGRIHAYDLKRCLLHERFHGRRRTLLATDGKPLTIDGLWALQFGNGASAGPATTLFFTAGPNDEADGLFGSLVAVPHRKAHDHDTDD